MTVNKSKTARKASAKKTQIEPKKAKLTATEALIHLRQYYEQRLNEINCVRYSLGEAIAKIEGNLFHSKRAIQEIRNLLTEKYNESALIEAFLRTIKRAEEGL